nr:Arm DNA-binding domain-containing protein [Halomonas cerina]
MAGENKLKLTTKALERLSKEPPADSVFDTVLPGFHVRPSKRGLTFRLYYRTKTGRQRILTIGRYGTRTVAEARAQAKDALAIVSQGGDPRGAGGGQGRGGAPAAADAYCLPVRPLYRLPESHEGRRRQPAAHREGLCRLAG